MSIKTLEREILKELRLVTKRPKLKSSEFLEWCLTKEAIEENVQDGEELVECPALQCWCIVKRPVSSF